MTSSPNLDSGGASSGSLERWTRKYGVGEAYAFERCASSHGGTTGALVQVWRSPLRAGAWSSWSLTTSYFDDIERRRPAIERGASLGGRTTARLLAALESTHFWSAEPWPQELAPCGTDGQSWVFKGVRDGVERVRVVWSPRDGEAVTLARAFQQARPGLRRWFADRLPVMA
ncbi:MAG: hypothetical protein WKG00_08430 [Polyangiaceae bacterium]